LRVRAHHTQTVLKEGVVDATAGDTKAAGRRNIPRNAPAHSFLETREGRARVALTVGVSGACGAGSALTVTNPEEALLADAAGGGDIVDFSKSAFGSAGAVGSGDEASEALTASSGVSLRHPGAHYAIAIE
jgi:hypothetical protein